MATYRTRQMVFRGLFFTALLVILAMTAMHSEAARRGVGRAVRPGNMAGGPTFEGDVTTRLAEPADVAGTDADFVIGPGGQLLRHTEAGWVPIVGLPGRATAVAASKVGIVYSGTENSGLLKSIDNGVTWEVVNNAGLGQVPGSVLGVTAVVLDEPDADYLVVATGYWLGTSQARLTPYGIFESSDGGQTWRPLITDRLPGKVVALKLDSNSGIVTAHWETAGDLVLGLAK